jgi:exonuclease III
VANESFKKLIKNVVFEAQNCQSLNISTTDNKTLRKILSVTGGGADVIFLSDLRMKTAKQSYATHDLEKRFKNRGYNFLHNSPKSNRGVGILVKTCNDFDQIEIKKDQTGNYLLIKCNLNGVTVLLGSVYGPNENDLGFYTDLESQIQTLNCANIIIAGDWNATWDLRNAENNIDVINMAQIPSKSRSEAIRKMANACALTDPYRALHPTQREFSYVPNARLNINRSRLDYFLISRNSITEVVDIGITHNLTSTAFDHKKIYLVMGKVNKRKNFEKINDSVLKNNAVALMVKTKVLESYLIHADPDAVPRNYVYNLLEEIGRIDTRVKKIVTTEPEAQNAKELKEELLTEAENIFETLPDINTITDLPLSCEDDFFFEGLLSIVKSATLSIQADLFKTKNNYKTRLKSELDLLKRDFNRNAPEIYRIESTLTTISENELREELENYKNFERLNHEKITPFFMRLAKCTQSDSDLKIIGDNDGNAFVDDMSREEYITGFYEKLYEVPEENGAVDADSIPAFLGDASNHPEVLGSKLNENEKIRLDRPLHITEFDTAISQCNKKSAPGTDGISNKFIEKFWPFLRIPLYRYAQCCYEKGKLTQQFKTAKIRLIPKKGDKKKIGNWRPISLLNCFYKLISRVLTNRLKKVIDKVTRIGQYGYSSKKQCQEVLIGLLSKMHKTRRTDSSGILISLDIKKAFDSVSHGFMEESLKFFNFGNNYIKWVKLLCTNREACVILNQNKLGKTFKLKRGNAQGDTISPYLFNICYQVLLLKFEFDLQIKDIPVPVQAPPNQSIRPAPLTTPVSYCAKRVFAFADDCNITCSKCPNNLLRIKEILRNFAHISGLECNVDKSNILVFGSANTINEGLDTHGFKIETTLKILGMEICNNFEEMLSKNDDRLTRKLNDQVTKWDRFNLSLPGRIEISKTMLYSQLCYLGCFLDFGGVTYEKWENIIANFAQGNLRLSKDRIFQQCCDGGLGLFRMLDFLGSQKATWIIRAEKCIDAEWKLEIHQCTLGNFYRYDENRTVSLDRNLSSIVDNMVRFKRSFAGNNNNYVHLPFFLDPVFSLGVRTKTYLTPADFDADDNAALVSLLLDLTMKNLLDNDGGFVTLQVLNHITGHNFTRLQHQKIGKVFGAANTKFKRETLPLNAGTSVTKFFSSWKRGSRKIRKNLTNKVTAVPHNMVKFSENTNIVIGLEDSKKLNNFWTHRAASNSMRTFVFKLHNNTLPYNTLLSHFVRGHTRNCTFCDLVENPEEEDETVFHLFFSCSHTERIRTNYFRWITNDNNYFISRQDFFGICKSFGDDDNLFMLWASKLFIFHLWQCKLKKMLPSVESAKKFLLREIDTMQNVSNELRILLNKSVIWVQLKIRQENRNF